MLQSKLCRYYALWESFFPGIYFHRISQKVFFHRNFFSAVFRKSHLFVFIYVGAYEQIRRSGFLSLSHRTTLNKYTGFTTIGTGFNPDMIKCMYDGVKFTELKEFEKHIILLFDGMKIKSGLVYSKSSGTIVGFTELGDINEEFNEFDRAFNGVNQEKKLASHVLCVMARGLFKHINYPLGYFSSCGFDSAQLFPVLWHATGILEMAGFKVDAMVSDGASPNRRFYWLHQLAGRSNLSNDGAVYWIWNRYDKSRKIYYFCDVPHLMKTLRNNLENSHGHNNTRQLMVSF